MEKDENFENQCQLILQGNIGMNFSGFWSLLEFTLKKNIHMSQNGFISTLMLGKYTTS
jgi:hypothetical protein